MGRSYQKEPFFCERDLLRIRGMQYLPESEGGQEKFPAIIISHGFTGDYTGEEKQCELFAREGYAAFCFSFCGGSKTTTPEALKSDGKTTDATIMTEVSDLIAVKDYVKALDYIDEKQIVLMGFSQGGMVSGLAAARCGEEIASLIMIYPALCIPDHARRGCLGGASYSAINVPEVIECPEILLGRKFHEEVVGMDVFLELAKYKGRVLLIQGMEDKIVNYSYAVRAKENYAPGQCSLQLVRGMGHSTDGGRRESITASAKQFLAGHKEVLTIRVIITKETQVQREDCTEVTICFNGYCESECFQGVILPGACDVQKYYADGTRSVRADYTLEGIDAERETCRIHIVNQEVDGEWKPQIKADSKALAWLENADATAVLEGDERGLTVRVFC